MSTYFGGPLEQVILENGRIANFQDLPASVQQALQDENLQIYEGYRPGTVANAGVAGVLGSDMVRRTVGAEFGNRIAEEYEAIRNDPERQLRQFDEMMRTIDKYEAMTGDPVEYILHKPNYYAATTLPTGEDVIYVDATAPHAGIFAHEAQHIQQNKNDDFISMLQQTGAGRRSAEQAPVYGAVGGALGALAGRATGRGMGRQAIGGALGTGAGMIAGSGQTAYEAGASLGGLQYLPEDVSKLDTLGDLAGALSTYAAAGPLAAGVTGIGGTAAAIAALHPETRAHIREKGQEVMDMISKERSKRRNR